MSLDPELEKQLRYGSGLRRRAPVNYAIVDDELYCTVGLHPNTMPDAELADLTAAYRLIHIKRTAPQTGADGPGELAWVWPLATMLLLPPLFRKNKKRES